ncbi:protein of unknown function [Methylacidimicrobium sp. AP8]|uniref:hypothetical protein n=1 Tax=Methylacidimicrobium sp. AP8 TaxID=2730359 RepID=UPI0018C10506|nr:hypothetical protein [Methylacidimicrobium sp. AP8]CAB4243594.1 protein of unknown function [Methylacidimicrobium sp. AP8]
MQESTPPRQAEEVRPPAKGKTPSRTTLLLSAVLGLLLLLLFLPNRRSGGGSMGKITHAAAETVSAGVLPGERSRRIVQDLPAAPVPKPAASLPIPPPGGVDAFGLPADGAFETGSAQSGDRPLSLASLAAYLPIWGYLEGEEVIVGGRVYHPGDQLVIRTPSGLCKARVAQIDRHCLVLRDEEDTEVRVPWPRASGGAASAVNEIFIDPTSSQR